MARAARLLHISQPSLSSSLSHLEQELGISLFERRSRGLVLTQAGAVLMEQAERILAQTEAAKRLISQVRDEQECQVRLAYISNMISAGLPALLEDFMRSYDGPLDLVTDEMPTTSALQGLSDGNCDLAICMEVSDHADISQTRLFTAPYILIAPANSPLTNQITLKDIASLPFVIYQFLCPGRTFIEELFQKAGLTPNFRHFVYSDDDAIDLVARGLGVSIVDAMPRPGSQNVKILHPPWLDHICRICLTELKGRSQSRAVRLLKERLLTSCFPY